LLKEMPFMNTFWETVSLIFANEAGMEHLAILHYAKKLPQSCAILKYFFETNTLAYPQQL